jgi:hypothetical protein
MELQGQEKLCLASTFPHHTQMQMPTCSCGSNAPTPATEPSAAILHSDTRVPKVWNPLRSTACVQQVAMGFSSMGSVLRRPLEEVLQGGGMGGGGRHKYAVGCTRHTRTKKVTPPTLHRALTCGLRTR